MEDLVTTPGFWKGKRVFLTGHTGFKGSWLALWLADLGAEVTGYALAADTDPSLFAAARIQELVSHVEGDVRDAAALSQAVQAARPEVVLHLAAQSLVRPSYREPVATYATNVMGTVHLLEAARHAESVRAVVCVTSDKCYENSDTGRAFRETDPMGGHDPYSSSKGAAELVIAGYRRSFFASPPSPRSVGVASARAGNVIGGGDWSQDRLTPDIVRALSAGRAPVIRSPQSVRPWQHVLEPLRGYLMLAERLHSGDQTFAQGWNFGPVAEDCAPVQALADRLTALWGADATWRTDSEPQPHEAAKLRLDCSKAQSELGWRPALGLGEALRLVVEWHKAFEAGADPRATTLDQIRAYRHRIENSPREMAR